MFEVVQNDERGLVCSLVGERQRYGGSGVQARPERYAKRFGHEVGYLARRRGYRQAHEGYASRRACLYACLGGAGIGSRQTGLTDTAVAYDSDEAGPSEGFPYALEFDFPAYETIPLMIILVVCRTLMHDNGDFITSLQKEQGIMA